MICMSGNNPIPAVNYFAFNPQPFPEGYYAVDLKSCENCNGSFTRPRCMCDHLSGRKCGCPKYCAQCVANMLMPPKEEIAVQQREAETYGVRKPRHIRYDDSMLPKEQRGVHTQQMRSETVKKRKYRKYIGWHQPLLEQFVLKHCLTAQDIQDVINCSGTPAYAMTYVWQAMKSGTFPKIMAVGYVKKTDDTPGRPPRIYALVEDQKFSDEFISQKLEEYFRASH